jgi:hypothetical protein
MDANQVESASLYSVNYYSDQELDLDGDQVELTEIIRNCIENNARAELWSADLKEKVGFVNSKGEYRLIKSA